MSESTSSTTLLLDITECVHNLPKALDAWQEGNLSDLTLLTLTQGLAILLAMRMQSMVAPPSPMPLTGTYEPPAYDYSSRNEPPLSRGI